MKTCEENLASAQTLACLIIGYLIDSQRDWARSGWLFILRCIVHSILNSEGINDDFPPSCSSHGEVVHGIALNWCPFVVSRSIPNVVGYALRDTWKGNCRLLIFWFVKLRWKKVEGGWVRGRGLMEFRFGKDRNEIFLSKIWLILFTVNTVENYLKIFAYNVEW